MLKRTLGDEFNTLCRPKDYEKVKVTFMGNITEIMYSKTRNGKCLIQKVDSENYIDLTTGELKQFEHMENRSDDLNGVRVTLKKLRNILNANVSDVSFCRWVTLTYAENMVDPVRLKSDFMQFNRRLRKSIGHYEYITAAEPQGRGAWHLHVVMIFPSTAPFLPNKIIREVWGNGHVTVRRLDDVDNIGAYLSGYLGDMELDDVQAQGMPIKGEIKEVEALDDDGNKIKKRIVKGQRLCMYPPKFNLYRCSKGIKQPEIAYMMEDLARKKVSSSKLTFERTICLKDEQTDYENTINYRYYNSIRK